MFISDFLVLNMFIENLENTEMWQGEKSLVTPEPRGDR